MDPLQSGFCNDRPKPYPSSAPSPATLSVSLRPHQTALSHLKGPRVRFSALLPALHLLKDALPLRTMLSMQQTLQPRKKIKVITNKLHVGVLRTDDVMHPNRDPFSRARIPYLECSPPRKVKSSIVELVKDWENVEIYRPSTENKLKSDINDLRDEFNWYFELATQRSLYPYPKSMLSNIRAIADMIFTESNFYDTHDVLAAKLLNLIRRGNASIDAAFVISQLLCLPHFTHYQAHHKTHIKLAKDLPRQLKIIGRRISHICAIYGHPEAIFWNVQYFEHLYRYHAKTPKYHLYRKEILSILESFAGAYPDTRAYSYMVTLECAPGGDLEQARKYSLCSLERATRPRGYELALIHAGKLLLDHGEALKALNLASEMLMQPVRPPTDADPFPFATRQRMLYNYRTLGTVAQVLYERTKDLPNEDAREVMKRRNEVLKFRYSMKPLLRALGVQPGDEDYKLFSQTSIDEIMYQLLDPEAVLEEAAMMKRAPAQVNAQAEVVENTVLGTKEMEEEHGSAERIGQNLGIGTRGEDSAESLLQFNARRWDTDLGEVSAFRSASRDQPSA